MKQNSTVMKVLFALLAALFVLACSVGSLAATATPVPTNIPAATNAPLPTNPPAATNTLLPPPTGTEIPVTPTPAAVGEAVRSDSYEVTVLEAKEIRRVYMGDFYYYPETGKSFVEVFVRVSNLTGSKTNVPWENIYIVEESGDSWYPYWGGYLAVNSGKKVDVSTIGGHEIVDGKATVDFEEDVLLHLIWYITKKDKATILFGFSDSPQVEFTIE